MSVEIGDLVEGEIDFCDIEIEERGDSDDEILDRERHELLMSEIYESICSEISEELDLTYFDSEQYVDLDALAALEDYDIVSDMLLLCPFCRFFCFHLSLTHLQ